MSDSTVVSDKMVVKFVAMFEDVIKTQFMQRADVFESFKVMVVEDLVQLDIAVKSADDIPDKIERTRLAFLADVSNYRLIAMWSPGYAGGWKDSRVRVVSNGRNWTMFDDFLNSKGFQPRLIAANGQGGAA